MSNYNKVERVLIGDGVNIALPSATTTSTIAAGDLFLLNEAGAILVDSTASAAIPRSSGVYVAVGLGGGKIRLSSFIRGMYTSQYKGTKYAAPSEQVTYVGFDAVAGAGSIAVLDNTGYLLRVQQLDSRRIHGEKATKTDYSYTTPSTGSNIGNLAFSILDLATSSRFANLYAGSTDVAVEVVANATYTALSATATLTTVFGSPTVVASVSGHGLIPGSIVRIGGAGATFAVYTVKSVNGAIITLTTAYTGVSGTVVAAGVLTAIVGYGFKLTGLPLAPNVPIDLYQKVQFIASFGISADDSNSVATSTPIKMFVGSGYWELVKDDEYFAQGYIGITNRTLFPVKQSPTYYSRTATYNSVIITHNNVTGSNFQDNQENPLQTTIYIAQVGGTAATGEQSFAGTTTDFLAILNGYFATSVGFPAITIF